MTVLLYALVGCVTLLIGVWLGVRGSKSGACSGGHHWGDRRESWAHATASPKGHIVVIEIPQYRYCEHDGCTEKKRVGTVEKYVSKEDLHDSERPAHGLS